VLKVLKGSNQRKEFNDDNFFSINMFEK
jgi:hypothetical protein